jgi:hypothetical protein
LREVIIIQQCIAISGDTIFLEKLIRGGFNGKVHSVYRQAINILSEDGELYSLVTDRLDNGPNTLKIRLEGCDDLANLNLMSGADVFTTDGLLVVGNICVQLVNAQLWNEGLPEFPRGAEHSIITRNLTALRRTIDTNGLSGGTKALIDQDCHETKDVVSRVLRARCAALLSALGERDFGLAATLGRDVIGLGGGSTPSGDDFCTGLLAAMQLPGGSFNKESREFARCLAEQAKQQTTIMSQAMLARAAEGRFREKIIGLLYAVTQGSCEDTIRATKEVIAIGSMSGTDLAVGIIAGLELALSRRGVEGKGNYGNTNNH